LSKVLRLYTDCRKYSDYTQIVESSQIMLRLSKGRVSTQIVHRVSAQILHRLSKVLFPGFLFVYVVNSRYVIYVVHTLYVKTVYYVDT
jgi:hypothetical protein